jgi:hypothetical protein
VIGIRKENATPLRDLLPGGRPRPQPAPKVGTVIDRLTALKKLADDGHITPAEHEERRREILREV